MFEELLVTPFVGVWIETMQVRKRPERSTVTPFVGVWIETLGINPSTSNVGSHPSWVCGLKLVRKRRCSNARSHTLRGCVD